jgi:hypothetical protein
MLGCTPAGAGARTLQGYGWCRYGDLDQTQQRNAVTGKLLIDRATLLPRALTARGVGTLSPVNERVSFRRGGHFTVSLPSRARHVPCMSWVPAIHCIELSAGRRGQS